MTTITIPDKALEAAIEEMPYLRTAYGHDDPQYEEFATNIIRAALDAGLEDAIREDERAKVMADLIADNLREVERSDESAIACYPSIVIQDWLSQKSREIESEAAK